MGNCYSHLKKNLLKPLTTIFWWHNILEALFALYKVLFLFESETIVTCWHFNMFLWLKIIDETVISITNTNIELLQSEFFLYMKVTVTLIKKWGIDIKQKVKKLVLF